MTKPRVSEASPWDTSCHHPQPQRGCIPPETPDASISCSGLPSPRLVDEESSPILEGRRTPRGDALLSCWSLQEHGFPTSQGRRRRRPCSCGMSTLPQDRDVRSCQGIKEGIFEVDQRPGLVSQRFLLARGLRRILHQSISPRSASELYRGTGSTPPEGGLQGGVS